MKIKFALVGLLLALAVNFVNAEPVKAKPVQYKIEVESNTEVAVYLGNDDEALIPNQWYESQDLTEPINVFFTVKYMDGEEVKTLQIPVTMTPGSGHIFKITINARPTIVCV